LNWICGEPLGDVGLFAHQEDRRPELIIGEHAAITNRHLIDCTNSFIVGRFSTVAGWNSQILTHSIDIERCRQSSAPIHIGDYCFIGTNSVLLGGSYLPDYCVLGAKSLLNKQYTERYWLYAGVPAKPTKQLSPDLAYFTRSRGAVD
jgi:acetyltransferase-like isoleucine patch superfamily enzyme